MKNAFTAIVTWRLRRDQIVFKILNKYEHISRNICSHLRKIEEQSYVNEGTMHQEVLVLTEDNK